MESRRDTRAQLIGSGGPENMELHKSRDSKPAQANQHLMDRPAILNIIQPAWNEWMGRCRVWESYHRQWQAWADKLKIWHIFDLAISPGAG